MTHSKTEYHLRVVHESELLHVQSESPFMLAREGEIVIIGAAQYAAIRIVHDLSLDDAGNLLHDATIEVEPRNDLQQHASV